MRLSSAPPCRQEESGGHTTETRGRRRRQRCPTLRCLLLVTALSQRPPAAAKDPGSSSSSSSSANTPKEPEKERQGQGVLIFKAPRTGSTWLGALLKAEAYFPEMSFAGEALQFHDCRAFSVAEIRGYLDALLTRPDVGKLDKFRDNRDALATLLAEAEATKKSTWKMHPKPGKPRTFGGFAPVKTRCLDVVDYPLIMRRAHAKAVVYVRTNVVKWAVARLFHDARAGSSSSSSSSSSSTKGILCGPDDTNDDDDLGGAGGGGSTTTLSRNDAADRRRLFSRRRLTRGSRLLSGGGGGGASGFSLFDAESSSSSNSGAASSSTSGAACRGSSYGGAASRAAFAAKTDQAVNAGVTPARFLSELARAIHDLERLLDYRRELAVAHFTYTLVLTYERLQIDLDAEIDRLREFVGLPLRDEGTPTSMSDAFSSSGRMSSSQRRAPTFVRASPEDLRLVLSEPVVDALDDALSRVNATTQYLPVSSRFAAPDATTTATKMTTATTTAAYSSPVLAGLASCLRAMLNAPEPTDFFFASVDVDEAAERADSKGNVKRETAIVAHNVSRCMPTYAHDGAPVGLRRSVFDGMYGHLMRFTSISSSSSGQQPQQRPGETTPNASRKATSVSS